MGKFNDFDIPRLYYFESGNDFTGSRGNFNYRIDPGEELKVSTWTGFICSELAEKKTEKSFPMTEEGFQAMLGWLGEMCCDREMDSKL